jgi:hypothetical protein
MFYRILRKEHYYFFMFATSCKFSCNIVNVIQLERDSKEEMLVAYEVAISRVKCVRIVHMYFGKLEVIFQELLQI